MNKKSRPSIFDELDLPAQEERKATKETAVTVLTQIKPKSDKVKSSIYMPPDVYDRLREIAFARRCKIHDLFMEGIEHVLTEHGHRGLEKR